MEITTTMDEYKKLVEQSIKVQIIVDAVKNEERDWEVVSLIKRLYNITENKEGV